MAAVGVVRFNFTVTSPDHTLASLQLAIQETIRQIPGISIAMNTFSIALDPAPAGAEIPPLPSFDKVQGPIRNPKG